MTQKTFQQLFNELDVALLGDFFEYVEKVPQIAEELKYTFKDLVEKNPIDALEKLIYLSFCFPQTLSYFKWYPQMFNKTLEQIRLQKGSYKVKLKSVLKEVSGAIEKDTSFFINERKGHLNYKKHHIIKMVQKALLLAIKDTIKYKLSTDRDVFRRAAERFKGKVIPIFETYDYGSDPETGEFVFESKEDENWYNVLKWLDAGIQRGYITPEDINEILSFKKNKVEALIVIPDKLKKEIENKIKSFLRKRVREKAKKS